MALEDTTDPYQYPVTKAYEMMSCFEGLPEYYRVTGIEKYKTAVLNFARRVMKSDVSIIGCCGTTSGRFDHSSVRQTDSTYQGEMQETCVTVTWMKLCLQLLALTGDVSFAECFETSLYNAYLGSINTENVLNENVFIELPAAKVREVMPFDSYATLLGGARGRAIGGARLGENVNETADILFDENDIVSLEKSDIAKFDKVVKFKAKTDDGREVTLVDFSSAGKTWSEDSRYVCWLPTKRKYYK